MVIMASNVARGRVRTTTVAAESSNAGLYRAEQRVASNEPPGGLYNILEARLLSLPPLPSWQVNMADS